MKPAEKIRKSAAFEIDSQLYSHGLILDSRRSGLIEDSSAKSAIIHHRSSAALSCLRRHMPSALPSKRSLTMAHKKSAGIFAG